MSRAKPFTLSSIARSFVPPAGKVESSQDSCPNFRSVKVRRFLAEEEKVRLRLSYTAKRDATQAEDASCEGKSNNEAFSSLQEERMRLRNVSK